MFFSLGKVACQEEGKFEFKPAVLCFDIEFVSPPACKHTTFHLLLAQLILLYWSLLKFTYLGSSVSSTKKTINTWLAKAWTVIDRLLVIWKSELTDKIKHSFFQAAIVLILLYGCTTWMLTKQMEKKLDDNYTRMLRVILNKSWRQLPCTATNFPSRKLWKLDKPDMQDTAGDVGTSS